MARNAKATPDRRSGSLPLAFDQARSRDAEGVRQVLRREQTQLLPRLARVRGRAEWVMTVRRDRAAALAYLEEASPRLRQARERERARSAAGRPGRSYMREQRLDKLRREELFKLDAEATTAILAALQLAAERAVREALPEGVQADVVARASLLVPRVGEATFLEAAELARAACRAWGYTVAVTGPWPPYRFGGLFEGEL
jgi:hypothetical protein